MPAIENLVKNLDDALTGANLPLRGLLGREFVFLSEHGSHSHTLWGTITGAKWSDENGLKLFVSISEFWGRPLKCLIFINGKWHVSIAIEKPYAGISEALTEEATDATIMRNLAGSFIPGFLSLL